MILDLFAGPGGWDQGLKMLGITDVLGIEIDETACRTAEMAGHARLRNSAGRPADVYGVDPAARFGRVDGVIASPPCQGFSQSGKRDGREDMDLIAELLECVAGGEGDPRVDFLFRWADPRSELIVEPMRYLLETGASWLILEQVPSVMPLWEQYAGHLSARGWSVDAGLLNAKDFGVPQDRERAVLVAHAKQPAMLPSPTTTVPVPASSVLGPGMVGFPRLNDRDDGAKYRARDMRPTDQPAFTVTEKVRSWTFVPDRDEEPRQVTVAEAGQLQSFPADYPWQGSRSAQCLQIANAVPPLMALAVLRAVVHASVADAA